MSNKEEHKISLFQYPCIVCGERKFKFVGQNLRYPEMILLCEGCGIINVLDLSANYIEPQNFKPEMKKLEYVG